ncbi:hypothetical protein H6504_00125 [Candidatus Woesearchaeota archaeon]|nr:hypothetical protein [Candidatus Woesearchaeota archaeon]
MKVIILAKDNLELADGEAKALFETIDRVEDLLFLQQLSSKQAHRLAFAKEVHELLSILDSEDDVHKLSWNKLIKGTYAIRTHDIPEREMAAKVYMNLRHPVVNLTQPATEIHFFKRGKVIICTKKLFTIEHGYEARHPKERASIPVSVHPKIARAMVNLTGGQPGATILDPCCGTGGHLLEAGLMGLKITGTDIEKRMVDMTLFNLKKNNLVGKISRQDVLTINRPYKYIVTDLPYAKNTKTINIRAFYQEFFIHIGKILSKRAVIGLPDIFRPQQLIKNTGLKITGEYTYYIHRSLTKKILVVEKA